MQKLHIAYKGTYTDAVLRAYRAGETFAVVKGVVAKRAPDGNEPVMVERAGLPVWQLEIEVTRDIRSLRRIFPAASRFFRD